MRVPSAIIPFALWMQFPRAAARAQDLCAMTMLSRFVSYDKIQRHDICTGQLLTCQVPVTAVGFGFANPRVLRDWQSHIYFK